MVLRPKLPVSAEQQDWIEKSFHVLIELFGREWLERAPLVLPTEEFFPRKWEATQDWAEFAFDCVCDLMHVPRERARVAFLPDSAAELRRLGLNVVQPRGAAGTYREIAVEGEPPLAHIELRASLFEEPERMVAVMAHELAHVLLLGEGRIDRNMERMEPLTDLLTVFSGFGILNANVAHVHVSGTRGWSVSRTGYLSTGEYGYALAMFAWLRGETPPAWDRELTRNVRASMRNALASFRAAKRPAS